MSETSTPFHSLAQLNLAAQIHPLWPTPLSHPSLTPRVIERGDEQIPDRLITQVSNPEMAQVNPDHANGIAMLILPGGGYTRVAWDKEGMETAYAMAKVGYTCFVLNYRMPGDNHPLGSLTALADAQRAMRMIRAKSAELGINQVVITGFSAGGHLAGWLATQADRECYAKQDEIDQFSARADLAALLYPVISMDPSITHLGSRQQLLGTLADQALHPEFSVETMVTRETPPCFLLHASDDPSVSADNSVVMWQALKAQKVPVEMHIVEEGGHGFGLRKAQGLPVQAWPQWLDRWIRQHLLNNK